MAFVNNPGAIETLVGDGGTYNWSDAVAVGGSDITLSNGVYEVTKEIVCRDATLNILDETIRFSDAISTGNTGNGIINVGELVTSGGIEYARNGCNIIINRTKTKMGGFVQNDPGNAALRQNTDRHFNIYGSKVQFQTNGGRLDLFISDVFESQFQQLNDSSGNVFLYTQSNSRNVKCIYESINNWETTGQFLEITAPSFYRCNYNLLNWDSAQILTLRDFVSVDARTNDFWLGSGAANNGFRFIDSTYDFLNGRLQSGSSTMYGSVSFNRSVSSDNGGANLLLQGSNIANNANITFTSVTDGNGDFPEQIVDLRSNIGNNYTNDTIHNPYTETIRKYGKKELKSTYTLAKTGTPAAKAGVLLTNDDVTLTQAAAAALTGINLNYTTKTATITEAHTIQNIFDFWSNSISLAANMSEDFNWSRNGDELDIGDWRLTIDTVEVIGSIKSTDEVIFVNGGTLTGSIFDINGDSDATISTPVGYDNNIQVYPTLLDAENETNLISNGNFFRYTSATFGGQNLWFRMTAADSSYIIENYTLPAAPGSYQISLVVTNENAALGQILNEVLKLDEIRANVNLVTSRNP